jgi:5-methylcytosine-specific restriction endonuclease McrA
MGNCRSVYHENYYQKNKERQKARRREHYAANREETLHANALYRAANKEKITAQKKEHYKINFDSISQYNKQWRADNSGRVIASHKRHYENNKPVYFASANRRKAQRIRAIPDIVLGCPVEKKRVDDIYKLRELISKVTGIVHHVDHMWPLSRGGPEWSGNMQIITAQENLSKHAKLCPELKRNIQQSLKELENDLHI